MLQKLACCSDTAGAALQGALKVGRHASDGCRTAELAHAGLPKSEHWEVAYEDCLDLIAKLPVLAATIYRNVYHGGSRSEPDTRLDWAANMAAMMGLPASNGCAADLLRLYLLLHAGAMRCWPALCVHN